MHNYLIRPRQARSTQSNPTQWLIDWVRGGEPTISGESISPESALRVGAYYAAIKAISEDLAKLPLKTYRNASDGTKSEARNHWAYALLHDSPNPHMTAMTFRETMTAYMLGWGNAYAELVWDRGMSRVTAMYPIHPDRVKVEPDENQEPIYTVRTGNAGRYVQVPQEFLLHLRNLGDGYTGWSVAKLAREALGLAMAQEAAGAAFFGNNSRPGGVITYPGDLGEEETEGLRKSWERLYSGSKNVGKVAILTNQATFVPMAVPNEDAQWLESRQFSVVEIARWFRIPPHKIASLDKATFSNIEHQAREYVTDSLQGNAVRWEQELKRKLLPNEPRMYAEHVFDGLLRGDSQARASFYRELFALGSLSSNDIRRLENLNPIEDGDEYFVPMNLQTLKQAAEQPAEPTIETVPADEPDDAEDAPEMNAERFQGVLRGLGVILARELTVIQKLEADRYERLLRQDPSTDWQKAVYGAEHLAVVRKRIGSYPRAAAMSLITGEQVEVGAPQTRSVGDDDDVIETLADRLSSAYVAAALRHVIYEHTPGKLNVDEFVSQTWMAIGERVYRLFGRKDRN